MAGQGTDRGSAHSSGALDALARRRRPWLPWTAALLPACQADRLACVARPAGPGARCAGGGSGRPPAAGPQGPPEGGRCLPGALSACWSVGVQCCWQRQLTNWSGVARHTPLQNLLLRLRCHSLGPDLSLRLLGIPPITARHSAAIRIAAGSARALNRNTRHSQNVYGAAPRSADPLIMKRERGGKGKGAKKAAPAAEEKLSGEEAQHIAALLESGGSVRSLGLADLLRALRADRRCDGACKVRRRRAAAAPPPPPAATLQRVSSTGREPACCAAHLRCSEAGTSADAADRIEPA